MFVFTDAWKQSVHFVARKGRDANDVEYLVQRMSYTYRRAAMAMLVTQMS